jgi:hypothetical protein
MRLIKGNISALVAGDAKIPCNSDRNEAEVSPAEENGAVQDKLEISRAGRVSNELGIK